jgi:hypothetical protein
MFLISCSGETVDQNSNIVSNSKKSTITKVNVEGKIGEELKTDFVKITVHDYEIRSYFAFDIEIENLMDEPLDPYKYLILQNAEGGMYGDHICKYKKGAGEQPFWFTPLNPGEKRRGIIFCNPQFGHPELYLMYKSKYGSLKIEIFDADERKHKSFSEGKMGEPVSNDIHFGGYEITVYSYDLRDKIGTINYAGKKSNKACDVFWSTKYWAGDEETQCQFLVLDISFKKMIGITDVKKNPFFTLERNSFNGWGGTSLSTIYYDKSVTKMLPKSLNVENMELGEIRRGEVAFPITKYMDELGGVSEHLRFNMGHDRIIIYLK